MNLLCFVTFALFIVSVNCLTINGKDYQFEHVVENNVSKRIIYSKSAEQEKSLWTAKSLYNKTYLTVGWDTLYIETNPAVDDSEQAFLAGYLEGVETHVAIYDHFYNIIRSACDNEAEVCLKMNQFLDTNLNWVKQMISENAAADVYWKQVGLFYQQMEGITLGYNSVAAADEKLTHRDIMWLNFAWDFEDLRAAIKNETEKAVKGNGHCSVLIKLLDGQSDLLVSHNSWIGYESMRRFIKRYTLPYKQVAATSMAFSGYPGVLLSVDDFYITNTQLVATETTNDNNNATLWTLIKPIGQVLEAVRSVVSNRLADDGRSWTKIFSQYNSGTYNNQWMIIDMKKFSPGSVKPGLLWVLEQVPGYIHREDQTEHLTSQGYWASYNRPFYSDIFSMMDFTSLVQKYGDFFSHDKCPRAQIFKRDQDKVVDIHSMMRLLRSNDFQHDPLSRCDCDPPYSGELAIAARSDLNLANGTYPFSALRRRAMGATDAKVTSYRLSQTLSLLAVCGPSTGNNLPPFQWSKTDFNDKLSHRGHPDLFNFQPVFIHWPQQHPEH